MAGRIRVITTTLTSAAGGGIAGTRITAIGVVRSITFVNTDMTGAGLITITDVNTGHVFVSGVSATTLNSAKQQAPQTQKVADASAAQIGTSVVAPVATGVLNVTGSGLGATKTGTLIIVLED